MLSRIFSIAAAATVLTAGAAAAQQPSRTVLTPVVAHATRAPRNHAATARQGTQQKPVRQAVQVKHVRHVRRSAKVTLTEAQPGLIAQAKVPVAAALKTALASQNGTVTRERIERDGGQLVYRFSIRSGQNLHRVMVNAMTGALVPPQARTASKSK